jgi:hypothetical protein
MGWLDLLCFALLMVVNVGVDVDVHVHVDSVRAQLE